MVVTAVNVGVNVFAKLQQHRMENVKWFHILNGTYLWLYSYSRHTDNCNKHWPTLVNFFSAKKIKKKILFNVGLVLLLDRSYPKRINQCGMNFCGNNFCGYKPKFVSFCGTNICGCMNSKHFAALIFADDQRWRKF